MPAQDSWRMTAGSLAISNYYFRKDLWMFPPVRELQKLSLNYQRPHPADIDTARRVNSFRRGAIRGKAAANAAGVNSTRAAIETENSSPVWVENDQQWVLLRPRMIFTAQNITRILKGSRDNSINSEGTKKPAWKFQKKTIKAEI